VVLRHYDKKIEYTDLLSVLICKVSSSAIDKNSSYCTCASVGMAISYSQGHLLAEMDIKLLREEEDRKGEEGLTSFQTGFIGTAHQSMLTVAK
jgi:hypothetical protein